MVDKVEKIWLDGQLVDWEAAQIHILTHTLHYGLGVFEGIRCYKLRDGTSGVFRLEDHIRRFFDSARICDLPMPYSEEQITQACLETIRANGLESCYIRPIAFIGEGAMGLGATTNPTRVAIIVWRWGAYLGDEGLQKGIRAKVSSFNRAGVNSLMAKGKICGHYVNSILAKREVIKAGYDEAILLDPQGYVSEASGENIFVIRDGKVVTPGLGASLLSGLTRDSAIRILHELGVPLAERPVARDELYLADEVFMVGTAAEVTPVREIDDRIIGQGHRGPITEKVQKRYFEIVEGVNPPDPHWIATV